MVSRETNIIFVVEGKNDQSKLKQYYPKMQTVITNGSDVSDQFLRELLTYSKNARIVLFLDPDGPGEKIRKKIVATIPDCEHIFVERSLAISKNKRKVGIEHMSKMDLDNALDAILIPQSTVTITKNDLFELGLIGMNDSKEKRAYLSDNLKIGVANGKTLLSKLNMFGVTIEDVQKIMEEYYDRNI